MLIGLPGSRGVAHAQSSAAASLPLAPLRTVTISTTEGTWMSLDVSPDGRTIAFELLGNIFTLPISGGKTRQLTEGPAYHQRPQFSSDGRFLVFTSDQGGFNQLWRMSANGGVPQLVPERDTAGYTLIQEASFLRIGGQYDTTASVYRSPGGRYEIRKWSTDQPLPEEKDECVARDFVLTDWATGESRRLASAGGDCSYDLLPASAFTPNAGAFITAHSGKIWRIAIPSGKTTEIPFRADVRLRIRPLTRFTHRVPEDSLVHARRLDGVSLSPDGRRVAFSAFRRIWLAEVPEGEAGRPVSPKRLTAGSEGEFWPTWSPDGHYIAFATWTDRQGGEGAIYRMRADGSGLPERLSRVNGLYTGLAYSGDGATLFAVSHPLKFARYEELDASSDVNDADIIALPANGGGAVTLNNADWRKNAWTRNTGLHAVRGTGSDTSTYLARFETRMDSWGFWVPASANDAKPRGGGSVLLVSANGQSQSVDTALNVVLPPVRDRASLYRPWFAVSQDLVDDIVLSPRRDRALVVVNGRKLYLVDVPKQEKGTVPTVLLDAAAPNVRLITPLASGAESPRWQPDGRSFTYAFGKTVYRHHIPDASAPRTAVTAVSLDVTAPRDLPRGTLALRHARLITMRGNEVIERGDLIIRDRRIVALGPAGTVAIPSDAHVVDLTGKTIMPGLVDLHEHIHPMRGLIRSRVWQYEADLAYGVLTCRDPQEASTVFLSYEDELATGELLGPRCMNTGAGLGETARDAINSLDNARQIMARYADVYQVRHIKEYELMRRDARQWAVMAAAERGLNVASHGEPRDQLVQNAIDGFGGWDHLGGLHVPLYYDVRRLLTVSGITLAHPNWSHVQPYFFPRLTEAELAKMRRVHTPGQYVGDQAIYGRDSLHPAYPINWKQLQNLVQVVAEGGRLAAGNHGEPTGLGLHMHLWGYAKGGMPPLEVLRAGTLRGAEALGMDKDLGSLEVGKLGDLLVLDGNPLENIRNTNTIRSIVFNGRLRDALTLDELWPRQRPTPPAWWVSSAN